MPTPVEWTAMIEKAFPVVRATPYPSAVTSIRKMEGVSGSALVVADDNQEYVVKGVQVGRPLFTDHIVARLGMACKAPVGPPSIVTVGEELIRAGGAVGHFHAGPAHATLYLKSVSAVRQNFDHTGYPDNRSRFARLAMLYGWFAATDHQFLYGVPPDVPSVYSVDHGHFLGGPGWTAAAFANQAEAAPDPLINTSCVLSPVELSDAKMALRDVSDQDIANALAWPPNEWGVDMAERGVLAASLASRLNRLANG